MGATVAGIQVHQPAATGDTAEARRCPSWDERVVALPAQGGPDKSERRGRELTPCTVQRLAEKAHAQRRGLRRQRGAARHVGHVQRAGTQAHEESQDDGCHVVFTDAEEFEDADAALVMPGRETDVAALGTGEGGVALPKAFPNADLIAMQAKDPDWLRYMQLVNKPRAQWPPHLAAAPLQFLYVAGVLSCESTVSSAWDPARTTRRPDGSPDTGAIDLPWPSPHCVTRRRSATSHARAPTQLLRGTFRAGHDLRARSAEVLVASAALQHSCVSSPMHVLYRQHAIFEAVALAQSSDRHAFRDRGGRHL